MLLNTKDANGGHCGSYVLCLPGGFNGMFFWGSVAIIYPYLESKAHLKGVYRGDKCTIDLARMLYLDMCCPLVTSVGPK